ncbi:MAG TPA: hypothetical protein PKY78_06875 [Candidatus Omnitrophota bacterium]|nr:hypothetical protein [Candidatus Omnitrophota bacterium]HPS20690.1 hypothetical protein [Candidatus Omnitrophota bacterium]
MKIRNNENIFWWYKKQGGSMDFFNDVRKKGINERKLENKVRNDVMSKQVYKHEVNIVFNKFYRDQVTELYNEVMKRK